MNQNKMAVSVLATVSLAGIAGCLGSGLSVGTSNVSTGGGGTTNSSGYRVAGSSSTLTICSSKAGSASYCWGSNSYGQLGLSSLVQMSGLPQAIPAYASASDVVQIQGGSSAQCALLTSGAVQCWSSYAHDNSLGQLGNGVTAAQATPANVTGITNATQIAMGYGTHCALLTDGTVQCWGYNANGDVGNGTTTNALTPAAVTGLTGATEVSVGENFACAVLSNGTVQCWGANSDGQLGDGLVTTGSGSNDHDSSIPVSVLGITTAVHVSAGSEHACAVLSSGSVMCWGAGGNGQLGNGATTGANATALAVTGITDAQGIATSTFASCALLKDGTVKCWGRGGQTGDGTITSRTSPVTAIGVSGATSIAGSASGFCAQSSDTELQCWGSSVTQTAGQATANLLTPQSLGKISNVGGAPAGLALIQSQGVGTNSYNAKTDPAVCSPVEVALVGSDGASAIATTPVTVNLSVAYTYNAFNHGTPTQQTGGLFTSSTCTGSAATSGSVVIPVGQASTYYYFNWNNYAQFDWDTTAKVNATATGLTPADEYDIVMSCNC